MKDRPQPDEEVREKKTARSRGRRGQRRLRETLSFCMGIALVGILLQTAGWLKGDRLVFPGVGEILSAFFRLIGSGRTWRLAATTLGHLAVSMAVSAVIGVTVGIAEGASGVIRSLFRPLMVMLRSLPMIVLVVVIMVLANYQRVPVIASSLVLIPMISEAACEGSRRIDRELKDVYRLNSGLNLYVLLRVHIPLMAGYLKQAFINAAGMGLKLAVTTEYLVQTRDSL